MARKLTVTGYVTYETEDDDRYVVYGGTLPLLLSGRGDAGRAADEASAVLLRHLLTTGFDHTLRFLDRRDASYEVSRTDHAAPRPTNTGDGSRDFELVLT